MIFLQVIALSRQSGPNQMFMRMYKTYKESPSRLKFKKQLFLHEEP